MTPTGNSGRPTRIGLSVAFHGLRVLSLGLCLPTGSLRAGVERPAAIPFPEAQAPAVSAAEMQRIHDEVKTPFKYGVVVPARDNESVGNQGRVIALATSRDLRAGTLASPR